MSKDWKKEAIKLAETGISWREVARVLDRPKSSVSDALRKHYKGYVRPDELDNIEVDESPRILFLDIETSSLLLNAFSIWNVNASLEQIEEDWNILSFCAKWADSDEIYYYDLSDQVNPVDDNQLCHLLYEFLDEADFVVGHNSKRFDIKKIYARMLSNGVSKPSPFRQIDTLEIAKREFGFTSNKLAYLTDKFCVEYKKLDHGKFSGFTLWKECMKGNQEAWEEMELYNKYDVLSLEELFYILAPWDSKFPNMSVYLSEIESLDEWEHVGYHYTNLSKFDKYRNKVTGQYRRGRKNLLSKEKRASLLTNIA